MKRVVECIDPEDHARLRGWAFPLASLMSASNTRDAIPRGPAMKARASKLWKSALGRNMQDPFEGVGEAWRLARYVREPRRHRPKAQPPVDHAERVRVKRSSLPIVVVRQELG